VHLVGAQTARPSCGLGSSRRRQPLAEYPRQSEVSCARQDLRRHHQRSRRCGTALPIFDVVSFSANAPPALRHAATSVSTVPEFHRRAGRSRSGQADTITHSCVTHPCTSLALGTWQGLDSNDTNGPVQLCSASQRELTLNVMALYLRSHVHSSDSFTYCATVLKRGVLHGHTAAVAWESGD